jgi:iron complex transport system ATP-binding protein
MRGSGVIHYLSLARQYCDRFRLIDNGDTFRYGDSSIITEESIREVYRVQASILTVKGRPFVVVDS